MTNIFISHTKDDAGCAETIRQGLESKGYTTWREPATLTMESILYPRTIENVILSSAAVVLVWSAATEKSDWVERHLLFAQQLKKPVFPVVLDRTELPATLIVDATLPGHLPCTDTAASLIVLPGFPPVQSPDLLLELAEKAAHEHSAVRKETIDQAADMLKRNERREEVLAVLEYLARHDLMMGVREKAQEVLDADAQGEATAAPRPLLRQEDSRHIFGARCKNGHVTYFDKRRVCPASSMYVRSHEERAGKMLDLLYLTCVQCGEEIVVPVDCEGYK